MFNFRHFLLVFLCLTILEIKNVLAQDEETDSSESRKEGRRAPPKQQSTFIHPLTNMPDASTDVKTSYYFPGYIDNYHSTYIS